MTRSIALAVVLVARWAAAADWDGQLRAWAGQGVDTNPRRDYLSPGSTTTPDIFLYWLGQAAGGVSAGRLRARGGYDVAARVFALFPSEDTVLQSAQLEVAVTTVPWLEVGVAGRARDRRGADRDYSDLVGGLQLDLLPSPAVDVRATVSAHRFIYWDRFETSWWGPDVVLSAQYRIDRRHSVSLFGQFNPRAYNANATPPPNSPPSEPTLRRDTVLGAGVGYSFRGPFHLSARYSYDDEASNSWGQTIRRHRFSVTAGVRLPWALTALASGTLQLASFPDGVYLSPELTVLEDDENASSVTVKLVRALGTHWELDVRYAFYLNVLPATQFLYVRHVVTTGVAFNF